MTNALRDQQRQQLRDEMRERRRQQLRDTILDATRALLEQHGYAAMVMDDVAAQAGISKPTLYSYFAAKDELVVATIVREIDKLIQLTEPGEHTGTPLQRLARILETVVQLQMHDQRQPIRLWVPEIHKLSCDHGELMQAMNNLDSRLSALVLEGVEQGEIDGQLDPATIVRAFYALVTAVRFIPHSKIGEPDQTSAPKTIAHIFAAGVARR